MKFETRIDREVGIVMADPSQIHQILMNLCTNAAHAMKDRDGLLRITLENGNYHRDVEPRCPDLEPGAYVVLTVADNGHGMDAGTMNRIFDPYFSTKLQQEGTGLGLSVVHGIVTMLGGGVQVHSVPKRGATFRVFLPVSRQAAPEAPDPSTQCPAGTETVLLVDDDEMVLETTRAILDGLGYRVTATASSIEALGMFREAPGRYDIVVTDQTMPDLTGRAMATEMLRIRTDVPIVLCTGFSTSLTREQAQAAGVRETIMKPVEIEDLAVTVRRALDRRVGPHTPLGN